MEAEGRLGVDGRPPDTAASWNQAVAGQHLTFQHSNNADIQGATPCIEYLPANSHVVVGALAGALSYFQSCHQFANLYPQGLNLSIKLSRLGSLLG